jgi:hypothetical protein
MGGAAASAGPREVEVGDTFAPFAVQQPKPVDVGPLEHVASDGGVQPELDEDHVVVASPVIDVGSQAGKAAKEPAELGLRRLDADCSRCQRLHQTTSGCSSSGSR